TCVICPTPPRPRTGPDRELPMDTVKRRPPRLLLLAAGTGLLAWVSAGTAPAPPPGPEANYAAVRPLVQKYCLGCHSTALKKGGVDGGRSARPEDVRKDRKAGQGLVEMVEAGEMPPRGKPQPSAGERSRLVAWARQFLAAEARARAGDPGHVPLRRLS